MSAIYSELTNAIETRQTVALATVLAGPAIGAKLLLWPDGRTLGSLGRPELDDAVRAQMGSILAAQRSERITVAVGAESFDIFIDLYLPPPVLLIIGAVHIAIPLVTFARTLGFHTIVLDARSAFATPERFGHADQLIVGWPADRLAELVLDEATYVVVLTHDEKIDNPALALAVTSPVRYIGALGARKTHARRVAALQALGVPDTQIARIHAPIGLELGARRPEEIAVSIIAQIVVVRNQS